VPKKAAVTQTSPPTSGGGKVYWKYRVESDDFVMDGRTFSRSALPAELAALKGRIAREGLEIQAGKSLSAVQMQTLMRGIAEAGVDNVVLLPDSEGESAVPVPVPGTDRFRAPRTVAGLVKWLGHPNAWQRETAQRLLFERVYLSGKDFEETKVSAEVGEIIEALTKAAQQDENTYLALHALALTRYPGSILALKGELPYAIAAGSSHPRLQEFDLNWRRENGEQFHLPERIESLAKGSDARVRFMAACLAKRTPGFHQRGSAHDDERTDLLMLALLPAPDDIWIHRAILSAAS
jgi:hypothetical protein